MSFWDWISAAFTGRSERPHPSPAVATDSPGGAGAASAVAEAPADEGSAESRWWQPAGAELIELTPATRPELTAEARAMENLLILHFDGRNLSLPSMPHVPEAVLRLLGSPKCSMRQVAEEIGKDQVAAAAVLRMANSPLYRGMEKITAIEPAVVRLGSHAVSTAMMNLSMRSVTFREKRAGNRRAEALWERALAGAIVMRSLCRFTRLDEDEAFLMGLLHDIGSIIVLRIANAQPADVQAEIDDPAFEYLCEEAHQEFGELLASEWALPARLRALISNHHTYPEPNEKYRLERLQLHLADMICSLMGFSPYAPYDLMNARAAHHLGLVGRAEFTPFLDGLAAHVVETIAAIES